MILLKNLMDCVNDLGVIARKLFVTHYTSFSMKHTTIQLILTKHDKIYINKRRIPNGTDSRVLYRPIEKQSWLNSRSDRTISSDNRYICTLGSIGNDELMLTVGKV